MYINDFFISWILIGTTVTTVIGILILILVGIFKKTLSVVGIVITLAGVVIGYGAMCYLIPVRTIHEEITDYEVAFTTSTVTLAFDEYAEIFYDAKTYNILSNKFEAVVYYEITYNSYNVNVDPPILRISKK